MLNNRLFVHLVESIIDDLNLTKQIDHKVNILNRIPVSKLFSSLIFKLEEWTSDLIDFIVAVFVQLGIKVDEVLTKCSGQGFSDWPIALPDEVADCRQTVDDLIDTVEKID